MELVFKSPVFALNLFLYHNQRLSFLDVESPGDHKAVNKILFINSRLVGKDYSSLIAGCSDGSLVFWNIHTRQAFARFVNMKRSRTLAAMTISDGGDDLYVANDLGETS